VIRVSGTVYRYGRGGGSRSLDGRNGASGVERRALRRVSTSTFKCQGQVIKSRITGRRREDHARDNSRGTDMGRSTKGITGMGMSIEGNTKRGIK